MLFQNYLGSDILNGKTSDTTKGETEDSSLSDLFLCEVCGQWIYPVMMIASSSVSTGYDYFVHMFTNK